MTSVMQYLQTTPLAMIFVGAHFVVYSSLAWVVVLIRACRGRFSRREWLVLGMFGVALGLEGLQLVVGGFKIFGHRTFGLPRYFGVYAPLLWLWAAKALSDLWTVSARRTVCLMTRGLIVFGLFWVFLGVTAAELRDFYFSSGVYDVQVAAERIAPVIRRDYCGPARQEKRKKMQYEYFTTRRPVVFSDMSAAAWLVRGQSEGPLQRHCPYRDDYLFVRVGTGYRNLETIDPARYDYVVSVRGDGTLWRLFRRKGVPHTDKLKKQSKENAL